MIPALFILFHVLALASFFYSRGIGFVLSFPILAYWLINIFISAITALQYRSAIVAPALFMVFAATHYSYGLGSLFGVPWYAAFLIRRRTKIKGK
jgi:hypothetical protein